MNEAAGDGEAERLAARLKAGDRAALARAITLVESTRADHRAQAERLLDLILPDTGRAIRIGLSGAPGVGKSTFTEAFGLLLTGLGHKVAVLAVDPSSARTGGSILGDKTRMEELARDPAAFIRPSPSGGTLGGVARRTREAMLLTEAAGYDVVLVETVGVGQSETAVADMVDLFVLLLAPGGGDALQGIKRGIMELADLVVVNKSDGDLKAAAKRAAMEYQAALHLMRPKSAHWTVPVTQVSALHAQGLEAVWETVAAYRQALEKSGEFLENRRHQATAWFWSELKEGFAEVMLSDAVVAAELPRAEQAVAAGEVTPSVAARQILRLLGRR